MFHNKSQRTITNLRRELYTECTLAENMSAFIEETFPGVISIFANHLDLLSLIY